MDVGNVGGRNCLQKGAGQWVLERNILSPASFSSCSWPPISNKAATLIDSMFPGWCFASVQGPKSNRTKYSGTLEFVNPNKPFPKFFPRVFCPNGKPEQNVGESRTNLSGKPRDKCVLEADGDHRVCRGTAQGLVLCHPGETCERACD